VAELLLQLPELLLVGLALQFFSGLFFRHRRSLTIPKCTLSAARL
jgi:hypothetical protein